MWGKLLSTIILAVLFAIPASAFVSGLESNITVGETPYELTFYIENNTGTKQPFESEFTFPSETIINEPKWIAAGKKEEVVAKIMPNKNLEGSRYIGEAVFKLGGNTAEKNIYVNYVSEDNCTVKSSTTISEDGKIIIELENNSYKPKTAEFIDINKSDWNIEGEKKFRLGGFEKREFELKITNPENFEGETELTFKCNGTEFTEKTNAKLGGENDNEGIIFGMVSLAGNTLSEIMLNTILVLIAAILLIAFIARLVKLTATEGRK